MNARPLVCLVLPAVASMGFSQSLTVKDVLQSSPSLVEQGLPNAHPALYYSYAGRLWSQGMKDEAAFWFYAGQLRYRFHLAVHPNIDRSGDPALFASLQEEIGRPINLYVGGDPDKWIQTLDRVLKWDAATPNGFTSKAEHPKELEHVRAGLSGLRAWIDKHREEIHATREQNGVGRTGLVNGVYVEERNEKMPNDWPRLQTSTTLEGLSGAYENSSVSLLDSIFFFKEQRKVAGAESIEISPEGGNALLVVAKGKGQELDRRIIPVRQEGDAVVFEEDPADQEPDLVKGIAKETIRLRLNVDGELVIQRDSLTEGRTKSRGPVRYSFTFWNRAKRFQAAVSK